MSGRRVVAVGKRPAGSPKATEKVAAELVTKTSTGKKK